MNWKSDKTGKANPRLKASFLEVVENQLKANDPPETKQTLDRLVAQGISRDDEVADVLLKPGEDRPGKDGARVAIGQTRSGRYLRVIYVPDPEPDSVFVITAYELTGKPLKAYRRRYRRRPKQ